MLLLAVKKLFFAWIQQFCKNFFVKFLSDDWKKVKQETIANCFRKAQLVNGNLSRHDKDEDLLLSQWIIQFNVNESGSEINTYESVDGHAETFQVMSNCDIIKELTNVEAKDSTEEVTKQGGHWDCLYNTAVI